MMRARSVWVAAALTWALALGAWAEQNGPEEVRVADSPLVEAAAAIELPDDCSLVELGRWARRTLEASLRKRYPWLTEPVASGSPLACEDAAGRVYAEVELAPHLVRPRWELHRELSCRRDDWRSWTCGPPLEVTLVRLVTDAEGTLVFDAVPVEDALRALATVQLALRSGAIVDPFADAGGPNTLELPADSLLAVSREDYCAGLLVTAQEQEQDENELLELCVEPQICATNTLDTCPWSVRVQGRVGNL